MLPGVYSLDYVIGGRLRHQSTASPVFCVCGGVCASNAQFSRLISSSTACGEQRNEIRVTSLRQHIVTV